MKEVAGVNTDTNKEPLDVTRAPLAQQPLRSGQSLLVVLRGSPGAPRLLCVPGAGAAASDFVQLAQALGESWHMVACSAQGMDGHSVPHSSVEAAASAYLRELDTLPREGEVHLVGHSYGGWVALEMALTLEALGRPLASLTIVDSEVPSGVRRERTRAEILMELVKLYELGGQRPTGVTRADLEALDADGQLACLHAALVQAGLISSRSVPSSIRGAVSVFETALRVAYRPRAVLQGRVTLVVASRIAESESAALQRMHGVLQEWRTIAPQASMRRSSGNHVTVLKAPHVSVLAQSLTERRGQATLANNRLTGRSTSWIGSSQHRHRGELNMD